MKKPRPRETGDLEPDWVSYEGHLPDFYCDHCHEGFDFEDVLVFYHKSEFAWDRWTREPYCVTLENTGQFIESEPSMCECPQCKQLTVLEI